MVGKNEAEARHAALYQDAESQGLYPPSGTAVIPRPPGRGHQNKKGPPSSTSHPAHEVIQPLAPSAEPQVCDFLFVKLKLLLQIYPLRQQNTFEGILLERDVFIYVLGNLTQLLVSTKSLRNTTSFISELRWPFCRRLDSTWALTCRFIFSSFCLLL